MRPACPPLAYGCKYLNFSRSRSELDLAARKAIAALEGPDARNVAEYAKTGSEKYEAMVAWIAQKLGLTSLRYQRLEDLVEAIGLPKEKLCTFCWTASRSIRSRREAETGMIRTRSLQQPLADLDRYYMTCSSRDHKLRASGQRLGFRIGIDDEGLD